MSYFIREIKQIYRSRYVKILLIGMGIVAVADPFFIYYINGRGGALFENIGYNPFQYWILMGNVGFGGSLYFALRFIFPVLSTGFVFFNEQSTSVLELSIIRLKRSKYFLSKAASVFITAFFNFLIILLTNLLITYILFPSDAPLSEQYRFFIPKQETFSYVFYQIDPIVMAVFYICLDAFSTALLTLAALGIHMIFRFTNTFIAMLTPVAIFYGLNYAIGNVFDKIQYSISIILQPRATSVLRTCITTGDVLITFIGMVVVAIICIFVGVKRNEDVL